VSSNGSTNTDAALGKPDFDVAVIGGGPAGAGMGAYLGRAGVRCVVFERELFPRWHVGESLVPSSTRVFKDLGFLDVMETEGFPRKFGAVWTASSQNARQYDHKWEGLEPDCRADIRFEERQQPGVEQNYTWHVDRGKFDLLLLQHAHKLGASVCEGTNVKEVRFPSDGWPQVVYTVGAKEQTITARIVIDASGRKTLLGNQLRLKVNDPVFDQYAIHTWFDDFDRLATGLKPERGDYIYVHFLPLTNSWVWQIPITETITSIGVVTQKKNFKAAKGSREDFFWQCVSSRPELHDGLRRAKQLRPFTEEGDYSYAMKQIVGDHCLLVGDAGRFVDPIFSTGVSIALNSARFAHKDVLAALESGDYSRKSFEPFEGTIRRGTKNWYEFISVYYRLNALFTAFITDPRYRLDVLKLLQGDVYDDEAPPVLVKMKQLVSQVEDNPKHVWHKLLGDLTANAFKPLF
jgi:FADH2 O2-dependent halogenase